MTPEVLTIGRVSVDLYPEQIGVPLADVRTFRKMLGGSPDERGGCRCAARPACHGADEGAARTGSVTTCASALEEFGVDASLVGTDATLRTPLAFCEIHPPNDFPLLFYREPTAPDLQLTDSDFAAAPTEDVPLLWMTGTGLSREPSRSATLAALQRRGRRAHTVFDLDYRPMLWDEDATSFYREAASYATVLVGNREEWAVLGKPPEGVEFTIEKLGPEGVSGARGGETVVVPPVEVEVVNGLGAGDAFGGALCHGLLAGWELEKLLRFANAAGALVASRLGCADEMPSLAEVEELLCAA